MLCACLLPPAACPREECRAECAGLFLCLEPRVLEVFGHAAAHEQADVVFANWLLMCRSGLVGLEFYTPGEGKGEGEGEGVIVVKCDLITVSFFLCI